MHRQFDNIISHNDSDENYLIESDEEEDDFDMPEECISKPLKDLAEQIGDEIQSDWLTGGKNMHLQFDNIISDNDRDENYLIESDEEEDDFDMPEDSLSDESLSEESLSEEEGNIN
nr:uncharacterized protein LOC122273017 isoform X1 [Parasteatoda tepidariorum]